MSDRNYSADYVGYTLFWPIRLRPNPFMYQYYKTFLNTCHHKFLTVYFTWIFYKLHRTPLSSTLWITVRWPPVSQMFKSRRGCNFSSNCGHNDTVTFNGLQKPGKLQVSADDVYCDVALCQDMLGIVVWLGHLLVPGRTLIFFLVNRFI